MSARFAWMVWLGVAVGCAPAETRPTPRPVNAEPEPESAEWLYATSGVSGGRKAECRAVPARIAEEQARCKGVLCSHGATLARDWLHTCKTLVPELRSKVESWRDVLEEKADADATPCENEAEQVLRDGTCSDKTCRSFETWGTRCAERSTPLVISMLETMIERRTGNRPHIDPRACPELLAAFTSGVSCEQQFKCEDLLPKVETYRSRCLTEGKLPTFDAAMAEISIRVGARKNPHAIDLAGGEQPTPNALIALEDGVGAVLLVCGARVPDLKSYLAARKTCDDELVIARRFDQSGTASLRAGRLPHPSDGAFLRRFPSLLVKGEREARYAADLPGFVTAITDAARRATDPKQSEDAIRMFAAAISEHLGAVRDSEAFQSALLQHDSELVNLLRAVGEAKKKAIPAAFDKRKYAPALQRAQIFALADIGADGRVKLGESSPAASVELAERLPQSMRAYRSVLEPRFKRVAKTKLADSELDRLSVEADQHARDCGEVEARADAAEGLLIACAFGVEQCDEARVNAANSDLDRARLEAESAFRSSVLAIASLGQERSEAAQRAMKAAHCREP